ncbi:MAG: hypothetical protein WDZ41_02060 [Candidatus Babeliales bacterium]
MKKLQLTMLTILTIGQLSLVAQNDDFPKIIKRVNGIPMQETAPIKGIAKEILDEIHGKIDELMNKYSNMYQKVCIEEGNLVPANYVVRYKNMRSKKEGEQWCYISAAREQATYVINGRQVSFLAELNEFIQGLAQESNLLVLHTQSGTRVPVGMELIKYNNPAYTGRFARVGAGLSEFTLYLKTPYRK